MVKRLLLLCLLYSILYLPILHAQTPPFTPLYRKQIVPLSPMAAALGKYVDIPVSLATGTPEISIPLYEVRGRELSLPISLSYHAGGFKVNELASWVGLGWSLNAGGMVGRTIRGMVDDGASYMKHFGNRSFPLSQEGDYNLLSYLSENTLDGQPDLYFFNFSGFNGKFIQTDDVYLMPKQPLRVVGDVLNGWEITAPNGDRYSFKEKETTLVRGDNLAEGNVTSWLLSEIVSANGTETIYFEYKGVTHREVSARPSASFGAEL